jgi:hypothetical protein
MVDPIFLSTFWDIVLGSFIVFFVLIPLILIWVVALADLFTRRDIRGQKVLWLLVIVFIPIFGSITYLLVRPGEESRGF